MKNPSLGHNGRPHAARSAGKIAVIGIAMAMAVAACGSSKSSSSAGAASSAPGGASSSSGSSGSSGGPNTASAPGVTATTVTIGSHQPLTGIAAPGYSEIAPSSQAYFDYVNAHGGVFGRSITDKYLDDGYNPTNTTSVVRQLVLQDHVFAIFNGLGTPTHSAVVNFLNSEKVPDLFVASGCSCWNEPSTRPETFGWQTDYIIEGKILGQYVKNNFAGKKIGVLYQNDDFGQDGLKGVLDELPGSQIVAKVGYAPTSTSLNTEIAQLQSAGADVVVSFTVPAFTAIAELTGAALHYSPQYLVSNVGSDPATLNTLLKTFSKGAANGSLANGIISDAYLPFPTQTSNSWISLFHGIWAANAGLQKTAPVFDGNVLYGMASAYTFVQALQAAGQNPTRASLVAAVEKGGFTGPGLTPFRFSSTDHAGYSGVEMAQLEGTSFVSRGPVEVTDDSSGGAITTYTVAPPTAPSNGVPSP